MAYVSEEIKGEKVVEDYKGRERRALSDLMGRIEQRGEGGAVC